MTRSYFFSRDGISPQYRESKKKIQIEMQLVDILIIYYFIYLFLQEVSLRIFQLFDHDEDGFLSQDEWIHFMKDRLK